MLYTGPQPIDLQEISALNRAFIRLLGQAAEAASLLAGLPPDLAARIAAMTVEEQLYVASSPFLVFSLRERDDDYWESLCAGDASYDLLTGATAVSPERSNLVSAALGFAWQLARRNPYTLRLICGATLHWCERLADQPLTAVIHRAASRNDILELRAQSDHQLWRRLMSALDSDQNVRAAVRLSTLQSLLIQPAPPGAARMKSAACRQRVPSLRVADDSSSR
ncbi:MAG: hypothetical protein AAGA61_05360 [Pseudomonadota bacterium]